MRRSRCFFGVLSLGFLFLLAPAALPADSSSVQILQFTPQGAVKGVRQITARFSEPMAPFGDPRAVVDPFAMSCSEGGSSRWVDSVNWVYDFSRDLPAGVRCTLRVRAGLKSLSGKLVDDRKEFTFSTGGPAIIARTPYDRITEDQAFVLFLDAEAVETSMLEHVSFAVAGLPERIGIQVLSGEAREAILKTLYAEQRKGPLVVIQARQHFPHNAQVSLSWGAGVASLSGVATEQDQTFTFQVRDAFKADLQCERENKRAHCLPLRPMQLSFSAPIARAFAQGIALIDAQEKRWTSELPGEQEEFVSGVTFKGPFPEDTTFRLELPSGLTDDAGRSLLNISSFPLTVKTGPLPPLAKFAARFGIVEWQADPTLPVTVRNLEPEAQLRSLRADSRQEPPRGPSEQLQAYWKRLQARLWRIPPDRPEDVLPWLRKVATAKRTASVFAATGEQRSPQTVALPRPSGAQAFEVIGIPFEAPGLYVVELESLRLGTSLLDKPQPMFVPTAALVTNLSVHYKWGRNASLVWVTTLNTGKPVVDAWVSVQNCEGKILWKGQTDASGIARLGGVPDFDALPRCSWADDAFADFHDFSQIGALEDLDSGVFVTAQRGDDLSFVHSSWADGIEPWRFQLPSEDYEVPSVAHTILDRTLFRAGETVHMKHILREQTTQGFAFVSLPERPVTLSLRHLGSDERYELPLQWDTSGSADNTWQIPKEAKLGAYDIVLTRPAGTEAELVGPLLQEQDNRTLALVSEREWTAGHFRVEEFRVPLMKAVLQGPAEAAVAVTELPVDMVVQYLAGGGASKLPVTLRSQVRAKSVPTPEDFAEFSFANGGVSEGVTRGESEEGEEREVNVETRGKSAVHQRENLTLDAVGAGRATITNLPRASLAQEVLVELEFRDPNGQAQTVARTIPLWPATWLVGVKPEEWNGARGILGVHAAVIDTTGKPVPGAAVWIEAFERKTYSHRKRLVGGFYAYDNVEEVKRLGEFCRGQTAADGLFRCEGKPPATGNLIFLAFVKDPAGNLSTAHRDAWVTGAEEWWFAGQDNDRIDVLPERRRYEPGETARVQVRMPFREATALVAVERAGGVLETSVVTLSGKEPLVEVPIKETYAPNIFVSVLVVRGRVSDIQPTALVDLGKPAFKLGVTELRVGWRAHELQVKVQTDKDVYRVRETSTTKIIVRTADGTVLPPGGEVAIAAVDAGLLELLPNTSWDLLEAMVGQRAYGMQTATAHMHVVGKRHYGLKALPQGGGGGRQATRELFDTLLLWQGRVVLDAQGEASVEIPLNDSLTSFRVVAVATAGVRQFGAGSTTIRTTQDLMVLPGIAPFVREGDHFRAEVTVRNTTAHALEVTVTGNVTEPLGSLAAQTIQLAAGEAKVVGWELTAPADVESLQYEIEVQGTDGARDRLRTVQQVQAAIPVRTLQATLLRWEKELQAPIERPHDALPGRGGVQVLLSPTLTSGLESVREWMRRYPYSCLEQQVSRAITLRDEQLWRSVVAGFPSFMDADGLFKYFPTMESGSDVLSSYILAISHEAGWVLPTDVQDRVLSGLKKFVAGSLSRQSVVRTVDLSLRKLAALAALARYGQADVQLLSSITIEPNLWPTATVLDWWSLLSELPEIPDQQARLREVEQILRARLNFQGTTLGFSTERSDNLWWLMGSTDTNAVRLLLLLLGHETWKDDLPRVLRGALARRRHGAWDLTVANAWGVLAVEKFAKQFESSPVTGSTSATLTSEQQEVLWAQAPTGATLTFAWPERPETLSVNHAGGGQPWVTMQSRAAIPLTAPLTSGYSIRKIFMPVEARETGRWSIGDIVRVRLEIDAQSDMAWVVVNDPIPAGAAHLGGGLARDTQITTQGADDQSTLWPAFEERPFSAFRAYYEFVPKGPFVVEYTIRLNQSGVFHLPPTRVEGLYAPEMFGESPNAVVEIQP